MTPALASTRPWPSSIDSAKPSLTARLPSDAPLRVLWGGDRLETNRHAFTPDQRWAYDLGVEPVLVGSTRLEDYGCWGTEVLSPIAGRVHAAHDGEPDVAPGSFGDMRKPLGNHVVLKTAMGTYVIVAHLQRGSVSVSAGEIVAEGRVLGRCGNSGNTSEPHIHLHHQRQDPLRFPVNFAEGLPLFFRNHDGAPMPEGGITFAGERPIAVGALVRHVR